MTRPRRLVLVTGTSTEVGKTWIACRLAEQWQRERRTVSARKPAQSFEPDEQESRLDASLLADATGELVADVCPPHRWYEAPLAPPMAAEALGRPPVVLDDLVAELTWPTRPTDIGLLETVGGVRSPIAVDGDAIALGQAVQPDVVLLVANQLLGVINSVRLSVEALAEIGKPIIVFLNNHSADVHLHERNLEWLVAVDALRVEIDVDRLATRLLAPL